jgi:tetratricopeptide (TPR) repeat protein
MRCCRPALAVALLAPGLLAGCQPYRTEVAQDHYARGIMAMEADDLWRALAELKKAVEFDSKLSLAHAAIGDIHRKQGNHKLAAEAYELACESNPYAFRPHYNLGVTYQQLAGEIAAPEAGDDYIRRAVQVYLRAVTLKPDDFDTNLNLSACYFQQGKYDMAEQYCKASIQATPSNPYAYSNLGIIYDAQNRPYDAIRAYKDSLERDVHQPKLLLNLGSTYLRLGRLAEALHAFELAAKEDPNSPDPWVQIGTCHFLKKDYDQASLAYDKARQLDDRCPDAYRGLGVVYMTQFLLDPGKAELRDQGLAAWNRSLEFDSNQPDLLRLVRKYTPRLANPGL